MELLILDEADRLLAMGFRATLTDILACLPKQRRTGLFSATMGTGVSELARAGMRNPRRVTVAVQSAGGRRQATPRAVRNYWTVVPVREKLGALIQTLQEMRAGGGRGKGHKSLVFVLTCACVDYLSKLLPLLPECKGLHILGLHGKMVQKKRESVYAAFLAAPYGVLLCTDVAARGLDVPDLDSVLQWDAPQDPDYAVHRAGRVGRLGQDGEGQSIAFLTPNEVGYVDLLRSRGIGMLEMVTPKAFPEDELLENIRKTMRADRDLHQKSMRAYVSQVRAYREHLCSEIFALEELDLAGVGMMLGLLRLPFMKELLATPGATARRRQLEMPGFEIDQTVDPDMIPFKDKVREAARLLRVKQEAATLEEETRATPTEIRAAASTLRARTQKRNKAWSKKLDKLERREKRLKRASRVGVIGSAAGEEDGAEDEEVLEKRVEDESSEGEAEQLRQEMAMIKKLKNKRMTSDEFDDATGFKKAHEHLTAES